MGSRRAEGDEVVATVAPLVEAVGARFVSTEESVEGDLHLTHGGEVVAIVRLPDLNGALARQVALVEAELGGPLTSLDFEGKRRAVRMLDERGAFTLRKGAEQIADALGVSRFTIYNYLNAAREESPD